MSRIHPTAVVDPGAQLAEDVEVGPFSVIGPHVIIGAGTQIGAHVVIDGHTRIGERNRLHSSSVLGGPPQDKKYDGEPTRLEIGDDNTIREFCTFNTGTIQDESVTRIGSKNWIMAYVHIAHDCVIGDNVILANTATLGGHVHVGDWVILGGMTGVHQFVRIGAHAMTAGGTILLQDLPPYVMGSGNPAAARGMNFEGLRRRGFSADAINALRRAYKTIYREGHTVAAAVEHLQVQIGQSPELTAEIQPLLVFLRESQRGIVR